MRQSAKRFSSLIISLALLFATAITYFNFISPAYDNLQLLRQDQASRAQFVKNEQASVKKVQNLISTYQGQTMLEDTISQALPQAPDVSGALLQLNGIAQITGMSVQQFGVSQALLPSNAVSQKNQGSTVASGSNEPLGGLVAPMGTLTFRIQLLGTYEGFKDFMKDVETNIRVFNVQNFSVHPSTQPSGAHTATTNVFSFEVGVMAYYQSQSPTPQ